MAQSRDSSPRPPSRVPDSDADEEVRIDDQDRLQRVRQQARSARDREDESHGPGDNHEGENPQDDSDSSSDALLDQPHVVRRSNNPPVIHHEENQVVGRRSRVPRARTPLRGFLNRDRSAIRSSAHAIALNSILQIASGHPQGIIGSFGWSSRNGWIRTNREALFAPDGPLGSYNVIGQHQLMRHIRDAQSLAKEVYHRDNFNDQTGAEHEEIPVWMNWFHRLFREEEGIESRSAQAERERGESRAVAASLVGRQGPLGYRGAGPADLRTETIHNAGPPPDCRQVVGQVETERVLANDLVNDLVEGGDDTANRQPAPRGRPRRGTHRRNAMLSSSSDNPSTRFYRNGDSHGSLVSFTQAMTNIMNAARSPPPQPTRREIDIAREYAEMRQLLDASTSKIGRTFYQLGLDSLLRDMQELAERQRCEESHHQEGKSEES